MCLMPLNVHLTVVTVINFMFYIFYHNKNKRKMLRDMEDKLRDANNSLIKDNDSKNGRKI